MYITHSTEIIRDYNTNRVSKWKLFQIYLLLAKIFQCQCLFFIKSFCFESAVCNLTYMNLENNQSVYYYFSRSIIINDIHFVLHNIVKGSFHSCDDSTCIFGVKTINNTYHHSVFSQTAHLKIQIVHKLYLRLEPQCQYDLQ